MHRPIASDYIILSALGQQLTQDSRANVSIQPSLSQACCVPLKHPWVMVTSQGYIARHVMYVHQQLLQQVLQVC